MSTVHSERDVTALVLATAQAVLDHVSAFPPAGSGPLQYSHDVELDWDSSVMDGVGAQEVDGIGSLRTSLGEKLRVNALRVERELLSKGHARCVPADPYAGGYRFSRGFCRGVDGEVECIVGAAIEDEDFPIVFDPESPLILEVFASDLQRSPADRVRILCQLVCIYSDAIRFGGFRKCPLGDAVRLLRLAVRELREHYTREASDGASNAEGD